MFSTNTLCSHNPDSDPTKSATLGAQLSAETRSEPISQAELVTGVTSISSLIEGAKEAMRVGDFLTLMAKLAEIDANANGLRRGLSTTELTGGAPQSAQEPPINSDGK